MAERLSSTLPREASVRDEELAKVFVPARPEQDGIPLTPEEEAVFQGITENYDQTAPEPTPEPVQSLTELTQTPLKQTTVPQTPQTPPQPPTPPPAGEVPGVTMMSKTPEFKLVMVDQSKDARDFARDAADARLTNELQEGGRFRKFVKGIWKGNLAKDYYRQKYTREAQTQIQASQDVLVHETDNASQRMRAREATIDRFQHEHDEMIHTAAGEDKNTLAGDSELASSLKGVIREYASGSLSDEALLEERTRVIEAYREQYGDELVGEGLVRADNILDIAQAVKGAIEHGESLDNVLENMRIVTGEARTGARTEAHYSKADKAVEWLSKRRITALLPEAAVATATAVASIALRVGSTKLIGAAVKTIAPGVGSAIIAGIRENKRTKDDRQQHSREMAMGKQFNEDDKRREQMEENRYETIDATDLIHTLRENHRSILLEDSERAPGETKDEALQAALAALSAVEIRNLMSDSQNIDLIAYSDVASVNEERMQLALARAELKVALHGELDAATRARLGLDGTNTVDGLIAEQSETYMETINEDISAKDEAFKKLKKRRYRTAAAVGFVVGETLGLSAQELVAAMSDTRSGLVEQIWDAKNQPFEGKDHLTMLESLRHSIAGGDHAGTHTGPSSEFSSNSIGEKGNLKLSNDHSLVHNPDGTLNFVDGNGKATVENLPVNPNGSLSPESIKLLEAQGMTVEDTHTTTYNVSHQEKQVSLRQYMAHHRGETTHVTRDLWYDNDTAAPKFDKNELGLQWTGAGVSKDGSVHMNVSAMTANGSFHDSESTNWATQAKEGKLQLAISPSTGDQAHPFMVDIKPDGTIDIPKTGATAQFFTIKDGEPVFNGRYAEVVQVGEKDTKGVTHIRPLATLVGTGEAADTPLRDVVTVRTPEVHPGYKITTAGYETAAPGTFTEMAPFIPVPSRRSMEGLRKPIDLTNPNLDGFYYGGGNLENLRIWLQENPESLRTRKEITNPDGEKVWVEADGSEVERSVNRERSALQTYLDKERTNNPDHYRMVESIAGNLGAMEDGSRVAVNVPAWMEEGNIKHFLEEYTSQVDAEGNKLDPSLYEINILVNRKTGVESDGSVAAIQDFITEFEQQHGFKPKVNYGDVELDPPFNNVGYARKLLTDAVILRSLQRTGQTEPLYIETEDADMIHVDPKTVSNLINKLDANPHLDAVRGVQDRSPEYMQNNDLLFLRRRAWDFFEIMARDKRFRDPSSPQWNFTWNRVVTGGWNTGYTAEAYGLIGGYDAIPAGEDMTIGEKITMIRGDGDIPNLEVVGTVSSRSDSSPRRFINEIIEDKGAYVDFTDEKANKKIREKSLEELLDSIKDYERINDTNKGAFESYVNSTFGWAKSVTPTRKDAEQFTHRLLFWIGFEKSDYEIVGDDIRVKSWDNMKNKLDTYRTRHTP